MRRKGIILAGGIGTRLHPLTLATSKQLLPIYDKPLIYYPLSVLMLAGVKEILIITMPDTLSQVQNLLKDGSQWGVSIEYAIQEHPRGLADAYLVGERFLDAAPSIMMLGDNILFGNNLQALLNEADNSEDASIFVSHVSNPSAFGVVEIDGNGKPVSIVEKPEIPKSNWAITGLYYFNGDATEIARSVEPSARGEIEITSMIEHYRISNQLSVKTLSRGFAWLDAGTHASLSQASELVRAIQDRQGLLICSPDEVAYRQGHLNLQQLAENANALGKSSYGEALMDLVNHEQGVTHVR